MEINNTREDNEFGASNFAYVEGGGENLNFPSYTLKIITA